MSEWRPWVRKVTPRVTHVTHKVGHIPLKWVISMREAFHTCDQACHTYNESCHMYKWVISDIRVRGGSHSHTIRRQLCMSHIQWDVFHACATCHIYKHPWNGLLLLPSNHVCDIYVTTRRQSCMSHIQWDVTHALRFGIWGMSHIQWDVTHTWHLYMRHVTHTMRRQSCIHMSEACHTYN